VRAEIETFPLESANEAIGRVRTGAIRGSAVLAVERGES
jgi:D-arabinose 1-dehydrogenase-like Zn-dependent alcohol dehydrogenase